MPKFAALSCALAASVATLAFPATVFAAPEETISIATLLKGGWQIAGYTSTLDSRSAFILFRHPDEPYLVQCRARRPLPPTATSFSSAFSELHHHMAGHGVVLERIHREILAVA